MKFASLKEGGRDGTPLLVSRDLQWAVRIDRIIPTLQQLLENWLLYEKELSLLYAQLNAEDLSDIFSLNVHELSSPLPRAYQWIDGSAYVHHVKLVRQARGAELPESFWTDPLMYQGGSDSFMGPYDPIQVTDESWGVDFEV